jgi:hypothetical protein
MTSTPGTGPKAFRVLPWDWSCLPPSGVSLRRLRSASQKRLLLLSWLLLSNNRRPLGPTTAGRAARRYLRVRGTARAAPRRSGVWRRGNGRFLAQLPLWFCIALPVSAAAWFYYQGKVYDSIVAPPFT